MELIKHPKMIKLYFAGITATIDPKGNNLLILIIEYWFLFKGFQRIL